MIANITFKSGYKPNDADFEKLRELIPDIKIVDADADWNASCVSPYDQYPADVQKLLRITNRFDLEQSAVGHTVKLIDKIEKMETRINEFTAERQVNERVSVHVPGFALMEIREAYVEENLCTDRLNQALSEGWRILAICPQPNQRRPDYVLGK